VPGSNVRRICCGSEKVSVLKVKEVRAKSILNRSKIYDYCLNPYTGCQINCAYCYARLFMKRYSGHKEPWGQFVDVKINAPEILKKQLLPALGGKVPADKTVS
jgi:DNA repair photolyase